MARGYIHIIYICICTYEKNTLRVCRATHRQQEISALLSTKRLGKSPDIVFLYMQKEPNTFLYSSKHNKTSVYPSEKWIFFLISCEYVCAVFFGPCHVREYKGGTWVTAKRYFNIINGLFFTRGWRLLPDLILYAGCKLKQSPLGFCRSNVLWIRMQSVVVCLQHNHVNSF